jgi:molecular chaperone GrpE
MTQSTEKGDGELAAPRKATARSARPEEQEFTVQDRRHSARDPEEAPDENGSRVEPRKPSLIDEYRQRAEAAEAKLQEYIEAFKQREREQDQARKRLERDVERKVELKFGGLAGELLQTIDALDLSLAHLPDLPEAEALFDGVRMVRDGFLATLERHGIERIAPDGEPFDPNEAEAMRVDPVEDPAADGKVTETLQPGYRLGEFVIRAARVAVGRHQPSA